MWRWAYFTGPSCDFLLGSTRLFVQFNVTRNHAREVKMFLNILADHEWAELEIGGESGELQD
jgi:hypothetical protein